MSEITKYFLKLFYKNNYEMMFKKFALPKKI